MTKELRAVIKWLGQENNSQTLLASRLGYKSSAVVAQWIRRNKIPNHMKERIMQEISK